jgi:hypothetical protein
MQHRIQETGRNSDCRMLSKLFLFLLYFVRVRWKHFITVIYYSVTKVLIRRLELCYITIIFSELCSEHFPLCNKGKVNPLLKHFVLLRVFLLSYC